MPATKLIPAAVLGGLAMFIWGGLTHMALPIYNGALQKFTNDDAVTQAILANASTSGTYFLPYESSIPAGTSEEEKLDAQKAFEERAQRGPQMFAFIRIGEFGSFPAKLLGELLSDILAVSLLGWLGLRLGVSSMNNRLIAATAIGLIVILSDTMSQWNWYSAGFAFTLAETVDQVGGWFVAGLVMAKILPASQASP